MITIEINNNKNEKQGKLTVHESGNWEDCFEEYLALINLKQEIINVIGNDLLDKVEIIKK